MFLVLILLCAVPRVHSQLCKLEAPTTATEGVWPGTNILLNCTAFGEPVDRFSWKKDGHLLSNVKIVSPLAQDGRHLLTWEGLKLENISNRDGGQYSCVVNKDHKTDEDWLRLHIFAKPRIISPYEIYIDHKQGDSIVNTCSAEGWPTPTVFWRKKGNNNKLDNSFVTKFGAVLHIVFAREEDEGMYCCYANNSIGTDIKPFFIHVSNEDQRSHIKVTTSYDHVIAYVNQSVTLRCKGFNIFHKYTAVFWFHNKRRLNVTLDSQRFSKTKEVFFWYTLRSVTVEDAGNYTCGVQTDRGRGERVIKLFVKRNGPPLVSSKSPLIYVNLGWPATLSCTLQNVDSAKAHLHWFKNESTAIILSSGKRYSIKTTTTNEGTVEYLLVIRNVSKQHIGCYGCYVNTWYGWNSSAVCLRLSDSSKDLITKMLSYSPSSQGISPVWQTTIPVFLVCTVVCMAGFIFGLLVRRNKSKNSEYWVSGNPEGYQYDVFITFSSKDFQWVKSELIPLIEKHNLNYCIHHRDFEPGKTIVDNMADSVYKSRHILAVLSKNYMSSTFCRGELDMALGRNTQMKDSSLIAIKVDEIEKKRLPKALRSQMFLDFYKNSEKEVLESQLTKELAKDVTD